MVHHEQKHTSMVTNMVPIYSAHSVFENISKTWLLMLLNDVPVSKSCKMSLAKILSWISHNEFIYCTLWSL